MGTYDDAMARLGEMRSRYKSGFSTSDRALLEELHALLFHKVITVTGCADCYRDAYLLVYNRLRRDKAMPTPTSYRLRTGIVLHTFGSPDYYTHDVADNVAEDYLRRFPENIADFERFPPDWRERVKPKGKAKTGRKK